MKRFLLSITTMSLLFSVLIGCSKDEVQPISENRMESHLFSEQEKTLEPKVLDRNNDFVNSSKNETIENEGEGATPSSESDIQETPSKSKEQSTSENTNSTTDSKANTTTEKETSDTSDKPKHMVQLSVETGDIRGTIFPLQEMELKEGDTVLDVTKRALGDTVHIRGSNATAYVEGIDNLYEFDHGALSGWLVKVDGVFITSSSGTYQAKNGQKIEWIYATDITTMIEEG
ncbi:DUF4430 domain-containing protein [Bacillaceae bacterium S4-13-58]